MIIVSHHVIPKPSHPDYFTIGGAYAVTFVNHTDSAIAIEMAKSDIDDNWEIESFCEASEVTQETYEDGDENLRYFEQALVDDIVTVLHTYPVGSDEEDEPDAEPGAAPNGGPATPLGNSDITEGPPSVS